MHVCERSGLIAVANLKKQHYSSQIYGNDAQVVQVRYWCGLGLPILVGECGQHHDVVHLQSVMSGWKLQCYWHCQMRRWLAMLLHVAA